jgi:molybdopterin converting factor small subunit
MTLGERFPGLRALIPSLLFAVGTDYADDSTPIEGTREIACFPPVSGG